MSFVKRASALGLMIAVGCSTGPDESAAGAETSLVSIQDYVPLSTVTKVASTQGTLTLRLEPDVATYVQAHEGTMKVAFQGASSTVSFLAANVDAKAGTVSLENAERGSYVVVSDILKNEVPVVTHWDASLNGGRGGQRLGATDYATALVTATGGQYTSDFFDTDAASPYTFNTRARALYSHGPTDLAAVNARIPDFERYLGENYSMYSLGTDYVLDFSNRVIAATGFPVVHLNGSAGCRARDLRQGAPAFQIVHACPVGNEDKQSLYTLIVPPYWTNTDAPAQRYPILFYGYYDIHFSFVNYGSAVVETLGKVMSSGRGSAIGVLWNGGASSGTFGIQPSMYDNASRLFDELRQSFSGETEKVVAVGCSRGGSTALAVAGNPNERSYRVKEVIAYSPAIAYGTRDTQFQSPTYPGFVSAFGDLTGYKYAWREGWREEGTNYRAYERVFRNTFGTTDPAVVDSLSPIGDAQLRALEASGTRVNLSIDTQDQFAPFALFPTYVKAARAHGIPVKVRINYRGTHCGNANMVDDGADALVRTLGGDTTFASTVEHYGIVNPTQPNAAIKFERITPAEQPVFIETPKYAVPGGVFLFSVSGAPNTAFRLDVVKGNSSAALVHVEGRLPPVAADEPLPISSTTAKRTWPTDLAPGTDYAYKLSYSTDDGTTWKAANLVPVVANESPTRPASLTVLASEPMVDGNVFCQRIGCRTSGWGLSSR